jgi:2-haloacid dehalogenase
MSKNDPAPTADLSSDCDYLAAEGIRKEEILHIAESLFHDHLPANRAGLASTWIYRRDGQQGLRAMSDK